MAIHAHLIGHRDAGRFASRGRGTHAISPAAQASNAIAAAVAAVLCLASAAPVRAGSLRLLSNAPEHYDFVEIPRLPKAFGSGEFTFEISVKLDTRFAVGPVMRGTKAQLLNWSNIDIEPYSEDGWWLAGNWLLDGLTRPNGFGPKDTREGSFGLQIYGGGRLRWLFSDGSADALKGKLWAVEAYPATTAPSLLDDQWHRVACVRRWRGDSAATLELWIDGTRISTQDIPLRRDMRVYWDHLPHARNPAELHGWSLGSEVMTAWNFFFTQYEDYKGLVDEIGFWSRAASEDELRAGITARLAPSPRGLEAHVSFDEGSGNRIRDRIDRSDVWMLHREQNNSWSTEDAP